MTRDEDQPQQVVADAVVERDGLRVFARLFLDVERDAGVLSLEHLVSAKAVDRAPFPDGHEPGTRIAGNARLRPLRERGDEGILSEFLGRTDVAHQPCERRDEFG